MPRTTSRPFKKFFCDRPDVFKLPHAAMKIWLFHYSKEGKDRRSWPSVETVMKACSINESDTVYKWRAWLVQYGWLEKVGEERTVDGRFSVPVFKVTRGTIPEKIRDGRTRKNTGRTHPKKYGTDAPEKIGLEVDSSIQVDSEEQVDGRAQKNLPIGHSSVGRQSEQDLRAARFAAGRAQQRRENGFGN